MKRQIQTYKNMFQFFLKQHNKQVKFKKYLTNTIVRGGTFWTYSTWLTFLSLDYFFKTGNTFSLTIGLNGILFIPFGLSFGLVRELYFDYASS